jgi:hypothetical protein
MLAEGLLLLFDSKIFRSDRGGLAWAVCRNTQEAQDWGKRLAGELVSSSRITTSSSCTAQRLPSFLRAPLKSPS